MSLLFGAVSMSLAFVLSAALPFFKIDPVYAQQAIDNSAVEKQRLGTSNILSYIQTIRKNLVNDI